MEKKAVDPLCRLCGQRATWVRKTQFSGDHYFCTKDAKKEKDFRKERDEDTFFWEKL